jgi:hypothetical protein
MFEALNRVPNTNGRAVWYMDRGLMTKLGQQSQLLTKNSQLTSENVGGRVTTSWLGIPVRRVDVLSPDEALVLLKENVMIMDERLEFADAASVAAAAGTALIGDVIDLGSVHRDIGAGQPLYLVITTDTEIITAGAAGTIKFQLVSDAQAAIATDGSATVHIDTGTFVTDDSAANDATDECWRHYLHGSDPERGSYV